jgi:RNA polymerase sigma factor (sigma-70 family)
MSESRRVGDNEIEYQRELHRRARQGDSRAMADLYKSMMPLIRSRVRRLVGQCLGTLGSWYDVDDLMQDAYLVFHRFVMSYGPEVALYRLVAGTFERTLRTHLERHGPLHRELPLRVEPPGGLEQMLENHRRTGEPSGYERVCAQDLLDILPGESDREIIRLAAAGYTGREVAKQLGCSLASLRYQRRRIRTHLMIRGITRRGGLISAA